MKNKLTLFVLFIIGSILFFSCTTKNTGQEIKQANDEFYAALNSMFTGDLAPLDNIWLHESTITNMGPFGSCLVGWDEVNAEFKKEAAMKLGGKVICKDLHIYSGKDMGYTVCVEEGLNMSAEGQPVTVNHRATNIFQLKEGKWKLIHHHTDLSPQLEKAIEKNIK